MMSYKVGKKSGKESTLLTLAVTFRRQTILPKDFLHNNPPLNFSFVFLGVLLLLF